MEDTLALYYEELLRAQYRVSEAIQQMHPRGTIREDFLREIVLKRRESLRGKKGIIYNGASQSGECDIIFYDSSATTHNMGDLVCVKPSSCKLVLEVKSNATTGDLSKTNANFKTVKNIDPESAPLCGLFCYNVKLKKQTTLERFGWQYARDTLSWEQIESYEPEYPWVDFIINVASDTHEDEEAIRDEQYFLNKDQHSGGYTLGTDYPVIKDLLRIIDGL